jgi:hypothetical protein
MKRTVVFEKGMLLGMRCDLRVYVLAQRGTGDLELMTFTTRSSNCTSCGDGVFCSLLRIPSEVSLSFAFLGVRSMLRCRCIGNRFQILPSSR